MRTDRGGAAVPKASLIVACAPALDEEIAENTWTRPKYDLYSAAWQTVPDIHDMAGVSQQFLARYQDFIDPGCGYDTKICAATAGDLEMVNLMTILSMNEGMASSFAPFGCPD